MHTRAFGIAVAFASVGCHPPPAEMAEAKRVVVVVGPPERAVVDTEFYRETPFETLEPSACAAACPEVARAGERLTACYVLPPHALGIAPGPEAQPIQRKGSDAVVMEPSLLHVCTLRPVGEDE